MKMKSEVNKDSCGHEHRALHSSLKHSSSRHYTSTSTKSSSSQIAEVPTKERHECRKNLGKLRSSSEEPEKRVAEAEEKRKKLMKRRASKEDDYPATKRRSNKEQADVGRRERKELVERGYRKSNEEHISEWKHSNHEKRQSKHSSKESKHPASTFTQTVRPKTQGKGHSESCSPPTSREEPSSSAPSLPITFKISKKPSVVKAHASTASWENIKRSPSTSKCSPKTIDSRSMKVTPENTRPRPTEGPSSVPSCSPPVQLVQLSGTKETSAPSSSNALAGHVSHTIFYVHKAEQIPLLRSDTNSSHKAVS